MNQAIVRAVLICAVAISTAALYGCSSGSKNVKPPPPPPPASFDPLTDLTEAKGHDLASITLEPGKSHYGERGVGLMCPAGGKACVVKVEADGSATFDATGGEPEVSINHMILAASSGPEGDSDGNHAVGLVTRIGTTNAGTTNATSGLKTTDARANGDIVQSTMGGSTPKTMAKASWAAGADPDVPTLKLTLDREAFGDLAGLPADVLVEGAAGGMRPKLGDSDDWKGVALKKSVDGGTTVHAVVYSNIEKPKETGGESAKLDLSYDGLETAMTGENIQRVGLLEKLHLGEDAGVTKPLRFKTKLTEDSVTVDIEVVADRIWSRRVTQVTGYVAVKYYELDDDLETHTTGPTEAKLFCVRGRDSGHCEGVQNIPNKGSVEGVWQLKTEKEETPDEQYLTLGTWLSLPDFPDGRFDAGTFANGKAKANVRLNDLKNVAATHTAEYEGPATGIYAEGDYRQATASEAGRGETPMVEHARVGSFAATASLTATFDEEDPTTLSGEVKGFKENGKDLLGNWSVNLKTTKDIPEADVRFTGDTSGEADGRKWTGKWGANFFMNGEEGPVHSLPHPAAPTDALELEEWTKLKMHESVPGYTAGTFSASTVDEDTPQTLKALHVIGAFGAEKQ